MHGQQLFCDTVHILRAKLVQADAYDVRGFIGTARLFLHIFFQIRLGVAKGSVFRKFRLCGRDECIPLLYVVDVADRVTSSFGEKGA